jgi:dsDNA-specific endonuclease/ATPase MutS2
MSNCNQNILEEVNDNNEFDEFGLGIDLDTDATLPISDDDYDVSLPQINVNEV